MALRDHDNEDDDRKKIPVENIVYAVVGLAFVFLLLFGPGPYDAMSMTLSQATPWAVAYGVVTASLFGCAVMFVARKDWGLAVAGLIFAGFACGMLAACLTVVQSGTW